MIANNSHKCNKLRKSSSSFTQTPVTSQVAIITQKISNNMEYMEYILFLFVFYINMEQEWGQQ